MVNWSDIFAGEGAGEEVLGECIQHVFPRNISCIFSDTVRIGRDQEICVLHAAQPLSAGIKTVCIGTYLYILIHSKNNEVWSSTYWNI